MVAVVVVIVVVVMFVAAGLDSWLWYEKTFDSWRYCRGGRRLHQIRVMTKARLVVNPRSDR